MEQTVVAPVSPITTKRGLVKFIFLSLITFGIYAIVYLSSISTDLNTIASRYDGKKTMHYCLILFVLGPITLFIADLVWFHKMSKRIGAELSRRGIAYSFGAGTYWGWCIVGTLIGVGPMVYIHKLSKAMNLLCANYNENG